LNRTNHSQNNPRNRLHPSIINRLTKDSLPFQFYFGPVFLAFPPTYPERVLRITQPLYEPRLHLFQIPQEHRIHRSKFTSGGTGIEILLNTLEGDFSFMNE
jgi:hypothetical protein